MAIAKDFSSIASASQSSVVVVINGIEYPFAINRISETHAEVTDQRGFTFDVHGTEQFQQAMITRRAAHLYRRALGVVASILFSMIKPEPMKLIADVAAVAAPRTHEHILKAPPVETITRAAVEASKDRGHLYHRISVAEAVADFETRYGRKATQARISKYDDAQPIEGIEIMRTGAVMVGDVWIGSN